MNNEENLICIYDNSKDDITKILNDIYADFINNELNLSTSE